jgi:hypothetical protein
MSDPLGLTPRFIVEKEPHMIRAPTAAEWDTSKLSPERRVYLDCGSRFEDMGARLLNEMEIVHATIAHYRDPAQDEPTDARQAAFVITVSSELCDLLYNAPDGLRGRYWQSPDHGFLATKYLIEALLPALVSFARRAPPIASVKAAPMTSDNIRTSLEAPSAKIWPRERDDNGDCLLIPGNLIVRRWLHNEHHAEVKKGFWRLSPRGADLEIKGAILGKDGTEYVPEYKRDRSFQIHHFGFT